MRGLHERLYWGWGLLHVPSSPELDETGASKDGAHGPLCNLAAVVLQFCGKDGPSLGVQLLTPVHTARKLGGWVWFCQWGGREGGRDGGRDGGGGGKSLTFGSHSFSALMLMKNFCPYVEGMMASNSHLATNPIPPPSFHFRYLHTQTIPQGV